MTREERDAAARALILDHLADILDSSAYRAYRARMPDFLTGYRALRAQMDAVARLLGYAGAWFSRYPEDG